MARRRRLGCETPRIWTKPLRELTPETSLGFALIAFAAEVCGINLFPWQKWLVIHALELAGDLKVSTHPITGALVLPKRGPLEPLFRFRKIVVLVARQNGKSTVSQVLALFFLYVLGVDLILGTAQDLDTAEEVWEGVQDYIDETPELAALADKPIKVNGKKTIRLLSGERYKVKAANRKAGRGLSGDLIMLDEIREHQTFDAWGAITKTTQARPAAQIWALSNAGDVTSVVLRTLRGMAHAALGDPDGINAEELARQTPDEHDIEAMLDLADDGDDEDYADAEPLEPEDFIEDPDTLGLFEWSAPPGCDVMDRDGWAQANPSMGYCIAESTIAGDARTEGLNSRLEWTFRTEVLCQWPDGGLSGPFPSGAWDKGLNTPEVGVDGARSVAEGDRIVGPVTVGIDMSRDRSRTYISRCGFRADGQRQAEVWAARPGSSWVADWLRERKDEITGWTGQERGAPVGDLIADLLTDPELKSLHRKLDLLASFGVAHDAVRDGEVRHNEQPALDMAAATAVIKYLGDAGVVDREKSPGDAAPLVSWIEAVWLHKQRQAPVSYTPEAQIIEAETYSSDGQSALTMNF